MDPVTKALLDEFLHSQQIKETDQSVQFEHFINYIVIFDLFHEEFDVERIATGAGEFGIDGVAIIVNDVLIEDEEQLQDVAENASSLSVNFVFTQAKTSNGFDTGDMSKFFLAVIDFFGAKLTFVQNERVETAHEVKAQLYKYAAKFIRGLPRLSLFYATTGSWKEDTNLAALRDTHTKTLTEKHIFSQVDFLPLDAERIQKLYFQTKNSSRISINFQRNLALPAIAGVRESYIGLLAISEYMKMVMDEHGTMRRRLFFDNVRDYQGETEVNKSIAGTIVSEKRMEFPLRNNGITIVTRKLQRVGDDFSLEDFQVVNGCQTSHVIANNWRPEFTDVLIPVKIIATEDEDITRNIIIASNSQNRIDQDSFWGLDPIHKKIEIYFESKTGDTKLFYERRPGQYNAVPDVEKVRIVTKDGLLKTFASTFLEEPNQVGRYYKDLLPRIGKDIFNDNHEIYSYYTAAFMGFRLEWLFRNRRLDTKYKPFRFQLCMGARLQMEKNAGLDPQKKLSRTYCEAIDNAMRDVDASQSIFEQTLAAVEESLKILNLLPDRRTAKMRDMRDALRRQITEN